MESFRAIPSVQSNVMSKSYPEHFRSRRAHWPMCEDLSRECEKMMVRHYL